MMSIVSAPEFIPMMFLILALVFVLLCSLQGNKRGA